MQEKAAEKMDFGISDKDKFIIRKGKEQFYFYGDNVDYHIKKIKDKYDLITKKNEGYKITNEQEDKYFKKQIMSSLNRWMIQIENVTKMKAKE